VRWPWGVRRRGGRGGGWLAVHYGTMSALKGRGTGCINLDADGSTINFWEPVHRRACLMGGGGRVLPSECL
jgi:hypothetical protein